MKNLRLILAASFVLATLSVIRAEIVYSGEAFGLTESTIPGQVIEAPFAYLPGSQVLLTGSAAYEASPASYGSLQLVTGAPILFGAGAFGHGLYWSTSGMVSLGEMVDGNSVYEPADQVSSGYYGWEFFDGEDTYYGWVLLDIASDKQASSIQQIAVNSTPNQGIVAGAVPEASTVILFGIGAAVLLMGFRRQRC